MLFPRSFRATAQQDGASSVSSARRSLHRLLCGVVVGGTLASAAPALAQSTWDRRPEQIGVVSLPGDPAGTYRISGAWVVEANGVTSLPLGTTVSFSKNGSLIGSQTIGVGVAIGDCVACPLPNTCLCAEPNGPCSCSALWLTTELPGAIPLAPGDVLTMNVKAAPGAATDQNLNNDTISRAFSGGQAFWNRRLISAQVVPSACPGQDLYDLELSVAFDFSQLNGNIPMNATLEIIVDGVATYAGIDFDACGNDPWITSGQSCGPGGGCGPFLGQLCGTNSCAGNNIELRCQLVELHDGALMACACSSEGLNYVVPGLQLAGLTPQSTVICSLVGDFSSSLAEIPSLASDNATVAALVLQPVICDADLNKDGVVDAADLGLLLSAWGACK